MFYTENRKDDLMLDFVSVITSFCTRIYGQRREKKKKDKMLEVIKQ